MINFLVLRDLKSSCETTIARENFPRSPVPSGIIWSRIREMKIRSIIRRKISGISIVTID